LFGFVREVNERERERRPTRRCGCSWQATTNAVLETNGDGSKQAHSANGPKTNTQNEKQTKSEGGPADARAGHETNQEPRTGHETNQEPRAEQQNQACSRIQRRRAEHVLKQHAGRETRQVCRTWNQVTRRTRNMVTIKKNKKFKPNDKKSLKNPFYCIFILEFAPQIF
jgi:hypothetical protein